MQRTFFEDIERQMNKLPPPGVNIAVGANNRHNKNLGGKAREICGGTGVLKSSHVYRGSSKSTHMSRAECMLGKDLRRA